MSERKRFHPLAIVVFWFQGVRKWLYFLLLLAFNGELFSMFGLIATGILFLFVLAVSCVKFFSQTYQINSEKIMIYHGIFRKREVDIPYGRIQTIKQRQWFFFRPFKVIQLLIETAGGKADQAEAALPAVSETLLDMIERYRHSDQPENDIQETEQPEALSFDYRVTNGQIMTYGLTDLSVIAPLLFLLTLIDEFIPENWLLQASTTAESVIRAGWLVTLALIFLVIMIVMVLSLAKTFIQYYDFRVGRSQNTLTIESGLLERKTQKIPLDKIQGIRIRQQIIRKLFGISTVELILAGGQEVDGESKSINKLYVFPIIHDSKLYQTLDLLLPEWQIEKPQILLSSYPHIWYFWRWYLLLVPVILATMWFSRLVGSIAIVISILLLVISWLDYRYQGYAIQTPKRICIQTFEIFTKVQTFVERSKIQSFTEQTSMWLYPKKIGHLEMYLKTGADAEAISLRFIQHQHVERLRSFYQKGC